MRHDEPWVVASVYPRPGAFLLAEQKDPAPRERGAGSTGWEVTDIREPEADPEIATGWPRSAASGGSARRLTSAQNGLSDLAGATSRTGGLPMEGMAWTCLPSVPPFGSFLAGSPPVFGPGIGSTFGIPAPGAAGQVVPLQPQPVSQPQSLAWWNRPFTRSMRPGPLSQSQSLL